MSSGKTCRFYLQGNCKFGSSCRYSHSDGGGHRDYHDEYQPKYNKNGGQQFYGDTNRNYNYSEREDYRNNSRYEKHNYNYDSRNNNEYEQNNPYYNYYDNKRNNQYEQNNHQYDRSNSQHVKKNYNRRNDHYGEQNNYNRGSHYEEENNYNNNYNYNNDNKHKNNYQSPKNYNVKNSIENNGKNNSNSQYYNKHKNKDEDYDKQPNYVNNIESFKNDYRNQTTSNRSNNYSNDGYDNNDDASKKEKMKKLYKNEIKIYQIQMKQMLENNYWPFTCYNPIGQSPIVEPVGSLNLMEASFEEIRCDYYSVKNICASPEMIHKQVYDELLLKAKKQKEDIVNLKDFVLNDLIATFQKWEEAKLNPSIKNAIPADKNIYWDMSSKRLKTPSDSKTLLDSFSFVLSDEVTDTNDTGPKILMQTEVYGRMENGFAEEDFIDYVPIMPPPQKHCL